MKIYLSHTRTQHDVLHAKIKANDEVCIPGVYDTI